MAAAVSDYRVENCAENKIKKQGNKLTLELVENPDILKSICKTPNKIICGFCAESENLLENAKAKIQKKVVIFLSQTIFQEKTSDLILMKTKFT